MDLALAASPGLSPLGFPRCHLAPLAQDLVPLALEALLPQSSTSFFAGWGTGQTTEVPGTKVHYSLLHGDQ